MKKEWIPSLLYIGLVVVTLFSGFGAISLWIVAAPLTYMVWIGSRRWTIVLAVATGLVMCCWDLGVGVYITVQGLVLSFLSGTQLNKGERPISAVLFGAAGLTLVTVVFMVVMQASGVNIAADMQQSLQTLVSNPGFQAMGVQGNAPEVVHRFIHELLAILPAIIMICSICFSLMNYFVTRMLYERQTGRRSGERFAAWVLPQSVVWSGVGMFIVASLFGLQQGSYLYGVVWNGFVMILFFTGLNGVAFLWWLTAAKGRQMWLRSAVSFVFLLVLFAFAWFIVVPIGMFDALVGIRRRYIKVS